MVDYDLLWGQLSVKVTANILVKIFVLGHDFMMDQRNKDFKPGPKIYLVEVKVDGACQARWKTTRQVFTQAKPWSGHLMEFDDG